MTFGLSKAIAVFDEFIFLMEFMMNGLSYRDWPIFF